MAKLSGSEHDVRWPTCCPAPTGAQSLSRTPGTDLVWVLGYPFPANRAEPMFVVRGTTCPEAIQATSKNRITTLSG